MREQQPPNEVFEGSAKVFEVVGVEERIPDRVDVRKDDTEVHEDVVHLALGAEGHHAIDGVEREPADDEEENDARQILRGLDLPFARRAEHPQHRAGPLITSATAAQTADASNGAVSAAAGLHRDDLL